VYTIPRIFPTIYINPLEYDSPTGNPISQANAIPVVKEGA